MTSRKNRILPGHGGREFDDGELIRRIQNRDEEALGAMMRKYSPRVFATALHVLHRRAEAQEVTQDVFLALWRAPERFDSARGALPTWLVILSRSRALDLIRQIQSHSAHEEQHALERARASRGWRSAEGPILVGELLAALPDEQKKVVEKAYIEGYGFAEIADLSGMPLGTVKGRARLALKRLRDHLNSPVYA